MGVDVFVSQEILTWTYVLENLLINTVEIIKTLYREAVLGGWDRCNAIQFSCVRQTNTFQHFKQRIIILGPSATNKRNMNFICLEYTSGKKKLYMAKYCKTLKIKYNCDQYRLMSKVSRTLSLVSAQIT